ncbi:hypothetical protein BH18ACI2_BH18ACI2_08930 [soil metagenome]
MPKVQAEVVSQRTSKVTREEVLRAAAENPEMNRDQLAALLGCSEQTMIR